MATIEYNLTVDELVEQYQEMDEDDQERFRDSVDLKGDENKTESDKGKSVRELAEKYFRKIPADSDDENSFLEEFSLARKGEETGNALDRGKNAWGDMTTEEEDEFLEYYTLKRDDGEESKEEEEEEDSEDRIKRASRAIGSLTDEEQTEFLTDHYSFADYANPTSGEMRTMYDNMDNSEREEFLEDIGKEGSTSEELPEVLQKLRDEFDEEQLEKLYQAAKQIKL